MGKLKWTDSEDIAIALAEEHPEQDPLKIRFTDLHRMVMELMDFDDAAASSNEAKLEAIQMAWYEEWKENQERTD
ncbi:MAG: Protein IscX [Bryobacteraceae bacterium]|nr:Protein IscX [Bryobacteraceae bacterium]